jgi:hypothetical protein
MQQFENNGCHGHNHFLIQMKKSCYLFIFLLTGVLFTACDKDDRVYVGELQKSYQAWINFKASSGNSYRYTVISGSWTGSTSETIITVESGKLKRRSYVLKTPQPNSNTLAVRESWDEDESTLRTHEHGAAALTLDEIYEKAKTEWLLKREDATAYFETKNAGMISSCGYVPDNCADDCFRGIYISSIEKL